MRRSSCIPCGRCRVKNRVEIIQYLRDLIAEDKDFLIRTSGLTSFLTLIKKDDLEAKEMINFIQRDPALTMLALKIANTSQYGLIKKVASVKHALAVVGLTQMKKALTVKLFHHAFSSETDPEIDGLWRHSLAVAIAAQQLNTKAKDPKKYHDTLFVAGILHDVGKLVIRVFLKNEVKEIRKILKKDERKRILNAEKEVLGVTHQEIGAFFAREWNLPPIIVDAIRYHHFPDNATEDKVFTGLIQAGNTIATGMELGQTESPFVDPVPRWFWGVCNIQDEDFRTIIPNIEHHYQSTMALFLG